MLTNVDIVSAWDIDSMVGEKKYVYLVRKLAILQELAQIR